MLQTGGKLSTRNGSDRDYDKWNISAALEFTVIFGSSIMNINNTLE
jgi:hypothetical protein